MNNVNIFTRKKEISILQEHDIGSKNYMLSVGEPKKQYKRVLANNHAQNFIVLSI